MSEIVRLARKALRRSRGAWSRGLVRLREPVFLRQDARSEEALRAVASADDKVALLVTVAFKRADLIEAQADLLRRFYDDSYTHVVVDNSPDGSWRDEIREVCKEAGSYYVPLPRNPAKKASYSHGFALNWAYRNIIREASVQYFGFLDHDIFPFRPVSYQEIVQLQGSIGHFQRSREYFFYWPGLVFFRKDFFSDGDVDFKPCTLGGVYLDTGGANWAAYYSRMSTSELDVFDIHDVWADEPSAKFDKRAATKTMQEAAFTILDERWVHLVNGSNWAGTDMEGKTGRLWDFMATRLAPESGTDRKTLDEG